MKTIINDKFKIKDNLMPNHNGTSTHFVFKDLEPCKCLKSPQFRSKTQVKELLLINDINNFLSEIRMPQKRNLFTNTEVD